MNLFIASEAAAAAAARPAEVMNHRAWKAGHAFLKMYWKTFKNKFELIDSKVSPAKVIRYAPQKIFVAALHGETSEMLFETSLRRKQVSLVPCS